ncbi:MAG: hypothetical protein ACOCP9_06385, partial [Halofilum sp. (in: g-proteobacteria)]
MIVRHGARIAVGRALARQISGLQVSGGLELQNSVERAERKFRRSLARQQKESSAMPNPETAKQQGLRTPND